MKLDLYNLTNEKVGEVEVSDDVFATDVRPHLFHEVVKMQLANRRRGTHKGKTRSEVSGGGKKPFKQKGTGNARQGTSRAPHMVGGGRAFARRNRDYSYALNKKKCRAALCSALSKALQAKVKSKSSKTSIWQKSRRKPSFKSSTHWKWRVHWSSIARIANENIRR